MIKLSITHGDELETSRQAATLANALARSIATFPHGKFIYLQSEGGSLTQSYASTWERARRILQGLRREGVRPGEKLILYFRQCQDFVPAIWACFLVGAVPVPSARTEWSRRHARMAPAIFHRVRCVLDSPRVITDGIEPSAQLQLGLDPSNTLHIQTLEAEPSQEAFFESAADELSLLVLSSGTTGHPNLVSLSASAVLNRWWPIMPAEHHASTFLSWSPFDHVMGMWFASPNLPTKIHLPTALFLQSPASWLDAVDRLGVTHCTMTNFGMAMIERQVASSPGRKWDLTSIRKIGIGGEAISPRTCQRFCQMLRPLGLRSDAVALGYGLSECGPVVGGNDHFSASGDTGSDVFVPLDRPTRGHSVRIVEGEGKLLPEGQVGAVQVRGPSMALGYFGDPEASSRLFTNDGWIRTGDLGAINDGRLTITGREKEIIIVNAEKYSCIEIEAIAQSVSGIHAAYAVACRDMRDGKRTHGDAHFALFFVAPSVAPSRLPALVRRLRRTIVTQLGFAPAYLIPVAEDLIPRTPIGKVQRLELAARLEAGVFNDALSVVESMVRSSGIGGRRSPSTEKERTVASIFARILASDDFGMEDDFFDLGGDSLAAASLVFELEAAFKTALPRELLHECTTVARLAAFFEDASSQKPARMNLSDIAQRETNSHPVLNPAIENRIYALTAQWEGERTRPDGLIRGMNRTGKKRPLFWCLQINSELMQLALHLGPDQPVYAMRSGHVVMDYTSDNTSALARRYMREMLSIDAGGPYLIAGYCQGCVIAIEIARQLQQTGREVELLTLLDYRFSELVQRQIYPGRVALFAGLNSRFNPYRRFRSPELGWRKVFPRGLRFELLPADHDSFFTDAVMPAFAVRLRSALDWAAEADILKIQAVPEGPLPETAYCAEVEAPETFTMEAGRADVLKVRVRNTGSATWHPSHQSGIMVGNHWLSPRGEMIVWDDGRATLCDPIEPDQAMTLDLPLQAPGEAGEYIVEIDLVEEGMTWFTEKNRTRSAIVQLTVSPREGRPPVSEPARAVFPSIKSTIINIGRFLTS
jgi:acyl-CoA synthetase (AMP-forming)/AMP-acid ligase II/acyl carrier protein